MKRIYFCMLITSAKCIRVGELRMDVRRKSNLCSNILCRIFMHVILSFDQCCQPRLFLSPKQIKLQQPENENISLCWKISSIRPLFKSGSRSDIPNYRCIAKLLSIPKLVFGTLGAKELGDPFMVNALILHFHPMMMGSILEYASQVWI